MIAPSALAFAYSSTGVSFDVNMIPSPVTPISCDSSSSGSELQSVPKPSSFRIFMMKGLGQALTAKYSLKPAFQANAAFSLRALIRMPLSS